jgi:hypothetical protein
MAKSNSTRPKASARKRCPLSGVHLAKLRGETLLAEVTIRRWAVGLAVTPANRATLERAAAKLGVTFAGAG